MTKKIFTLASLIVFFTYGSAYAAMPNNTGAINNAVKSSAMSVKKPYPVYHKGDKLYPVQNKTVNKAVKVKKVKNKIPAVKKNTVKNVKNTAIKNVAISSSAIKGKKKVSITSLVIKPVIIHIKKGMTRVIKLSISSINRIVTNSYIKSVKTSKTGNISVLLQGKNAYIQFTPLLMKQGNKTKIKYPASITSVIFNTKDGIFTLVLVPKYIPAQTIYIKQNTYSHRTHAKFYKINKKGFSHYLASIYKNVYNNIIPNGYSLKKMYKVYNTAYPQIKVVLVKKYSGGFRIYEFHIYNNLDKNVSLSNKEFLSLIPNTLSISLSNEHIFKGSYTRLFIVARGINNG
jgi:hypothetical protein